MDRDTLVSELSLWLDPTVIAEAIVDGLEQIEAPMTVEMAKKVWLNVLETELPSAVKASAKAVVRRSTMRWLCKLIGHKYRVETTEPDLSTKWSAEVFGVVRERCWCTRYLCCRRCRATFTRRSISTL